MHCSRRSDPGCEPSRIEGQAGAIDGVTAAASLPREASCKDFPSLAQLLSFSANTFRNFATLGATTNAQYDCSGWFAK